MKKVYSTDDVEIVGISGTNHGGRSRPLSKSSRYQEQRQELVHYKLIPTGQTGEVEIPMGHYTKSEMQKLREKGKQTFLANLGDS